MTKGQMAKKEFVHNYIEPMLAGIDSRISSVEYTADEHREQVTIQWETEDGHIKDAVNINVTYDSKAAMVHDIIKTFL